MEIDFQPILDVAIQIANFELGDSGIRLWMVAVAAGLLGGLVNRGRRDEEDREND